MYFYKTFEAVNGYRILPVLQVMLYHTAQVWQWQLCEFVKPFIKVNWETRNVKAITRGTYVWMSACKD